MWELEGRRRSTQTVLPIDNEEGVLNLCQLFPSLFISPFLLLYEIERENETELYFLFSREGNNYFWIIRLSLFFSMANNNNTTTTFSSGSMHGITTKSPGACCYLYPNAHCFASRVTLSVTFLLLV